MNKFKYSVLSIIMVVGVLFTIAPNVKAADKLASCATGLEFYNNGQPYEGKSVLINPTSKYVLQIGIGQLSDSTCEPPIYWKVTSNGDPLDNGLISNNQDFTKNITLGSAAPKRYTYILTISEDESFSTGNQYKSIEVFFTDDPKLGSTGGTNSNSNTPANSNSANGNGNTGNLPTNVDTSTSANFNVNLDENLGTFDPLITPKSLPELIAKIISILFILVGIAAVIVIILAGFKMVTSSGNESELTKAKAAITWAVVGLIVSILAFSIVAIVEGVIKNRL